MTRDEALRTATRRLAGADTPARDARALLLHVTGIAPHHLISHGDTPLTPDEITRFEQAITRRAASEPVSRIIGIRAFYGHDFTVTDAVLDPRPDTETLVDAVLDHVRERGLSDAPLRILDLGTGSGCILLALLNALPRAEGLGVDSSPDALNVARINARRLHLSKKSTFRQSNWLEKVDGAFDLVVCNPPYIGEHEADTLSDDVLEWDPAGALFADEDGFADYRAIAPVLGEALLTTGTAFFEIGLGQDEAVTRLFSEAGFDDLTFRRDIAGINRCLIARRSR